MRWLHYFTMILIWDLVLNVLSVDSNWNLFLIENFKWIFLAFNFNCVDLVDDANTQSIWWQIQTWLNELCTRVRGRNIIRNYLSLMRFLLLMNFPWFFFHLHFTNLLKSIWLVVIKDRSWWFFLLFLLFFFSSSCSFDKILSKSISLDELCDRLDRRAIYTPKSNSSTQIISRGGNIILYVYYISR